MSGYQTEEEQIEALKKFWRRYGTPILSIIVAIVIGSYGYDYWQSKQQQQAAQAATLYHTLLAAVEKPSENSQVLIDDLSAKLASDYPATPYVALAFLLQAKQAVEQNDFAGAAATLRKAVEHGKEEELRAIASIRLARVLAAMQQTEQALQQLATVQLAAFQARVAEVRGDILLQQGDAVAAKEAYQQASLAYSSEEAREVVIIKLSDLNGFSSRHTVEQSQTEESS